MHGPACVMPSSGVGAHAPKYFKSNEAMYRRNALGRLSK
jgi:hypothetical protein